MKIEEIVSLALSEDLGSGDHTSLATIPASATNRAGLLVKEDGVIAGINVAKEVFHQVDPDLKFVGLLNDGQAVRRGDIAFTLAGKSISILSGERLALNFMQRMSGIATSTRRMVDLLKGLDVKLLDTRKTTPNLRVLEKNAVKAGGGANHRFGLFDMILIKDNHVDFAGGISEALGATKKYLAEKGLDLKIEIEVRDFNELNEVLEIGGVDRIMLDNFTVDGLRTAINIIDGRFKTEASGGITMETIRQYAETGVDYISVGALTHHIKGLDMSLKAVRNF
ncbi:MAG: nicotinate-nucleotide diphosphorylase (carboxylating) [Bacteroidetes bacterium 4484_276]|nr:MAG: nicotinate-nucleotide diphosphorylase (carboxylating) [Bacteroidetes bacterium 4484_276]OYT14127.1 MAG: nicotinate-nucleotide diphosphorylase (carboxylating) [Bacteroidetes bacterium 4572_114]